MPKIHTMIFVLPWKNNRITYTRRTWRSYRFPHLCWLYHSTLLRFHDCKIIAVAQTRDEAINTMSRALSEYVIEGIKTTIPFHQQLMQNEDFRTGNFTTKFMESFVLK